MCEHERLLQILKRFPQDYRPWGDDDREVGEFFGDDCSCGCRFARWLEDLGEEHLSRDWCVCTNPKSHRCGLLTFEHQGCRAFEMESEGAK